MSLSYSLLNDLALKYGDAYYLFREHDFLHNYKSMLSWFRSVYSNTHIGYSYKTNYLPHICKLINKSGGYAEVTSALEFELAKKIGTPYFNMILNGPIHSKDLLEECMKVGVIVNIDGFTQLSYVKEICAAYSTQEFEIGLRLNVENPQNFTSRFGFWVNGGAAQKAVEIVEGIGNCQLTGLHTHYWLPERKPSSFAGRLEKMFDFALTNDLVKSLKYLNIGGSFYGPMDESLKSQFSHTIPTFEEYAKVIGSLMKSYFPEENVRLYIEPGVSLVGNTMDYVGRIYDIKTIDQAHFALINGSVHNVKPSLHPYNLKLSSYSNKVTKTSNRKYQIAGYTCLEYDILRKDFSANLEIGDFLCFHNIGAYTVSMKSPFIKGAPPILEQKANNCEVIRRSETFDDLFSSFVI